MNRPYDREVLNISIHTFLTEGDGSGAAAFFLRYISIHTFLTEGDPAFKESSAAIHISIHTFLTEGDAIQSRELRPVDISIHTFLTEGDILRIPDKDVAIVFQSTPSSQKVTESHGR